MITRNEPYLRVGNACMDSGWLQVDSQGLASKTLAYKYTRREFAEALCSRGSIKIGTLHEYRKTEIEQLGDDGEWTATLNAVIDEAHLRPNTPPRNWQELIVKDMFCGDFHGDFEGLVFKDAGYISPDEYIPESLYELFP